MNVQNVSSLPEYIDNFIQFNKNKLMEIYNEGINMHNSGLLYFQCDKDNNNVDVYSYRGYRKERGKVKFTSKKDNPFKKLMSLNLK